MVLPLYRAYTYCADAATEVNEECIEDDKGGVARLQHLVDIKNLIFPVAFG